MAGEQFDLAKTATEAAQNMVNGQISGLRNTAAEFNLGNLWNNMLKWLNKFCNNNNIKLPEFLKLSEIEPSAPATAQASNEAAARAAADKVRNGDVKLAEGTSPNTTPATAKTPRQVG